MSLAFIAIGNAFRRDDGVGTTIVSELKNTIGDDHTGISFLECSGDGAGLMELWKGFQQVFLFDAVMSDQSPGTVHRLDANKNVMPSDFFKYSSHAFSLAEAVEMARVLDRLPDQLIVYGIEGTDFDHGEGLSEAVQAAVNVVVKRVLRDING